MTLINHIFSLFLIKEIIFLTLFIRFEKICFRFKYNTGQNLRNNLFNFITQNEENCFFKLKKIFLWITLHICLYVNFFNSKKNNFQEISLHQRNFSLTLQQYTNLFYSKNFFLKSTKLFSEWKLTNSVKRLFNF